MNDWPLRSDNTRKVSWPKPEVCAVLLICRDWAAAGKGDECFWKPFPGCPSQDLTPNMVIRALHEASEPK